MQPGEAVSAMNALGHTIRLELYRTLVRAGRDGMAIGVIQSRLGGVPRSTLAHHLGKLVAAGLVSQWREGASVISTADYTQMDALVAYLTAECCIDETSDDPGPTT